MHGAGVALAEARQRAVRGTDFQIKSTFAQIGVLQGDVDHPLRQVLFKMLVEDYIEHVVFTDAHSQRTDAGGVVHADLQHRGRRDSAGIRRNLDGRAVHILKKSIAADNQGGYDQQN